MAGLLLLKKLIKDLVCLVVWDTADYLRKAEKQLSHKNVCQEETN